jgi:hypothetical protein
MSIEQTPRNTSTAAVAGQWSDYHNYGHEEVHSHSHASEGRSQLENDVITERRVFRRALMTMVGYRRHAMAVNQRRRREWSLLPERHRSLLPSYGDKLASLEAAVEANAQFLRTVAAHACQFADIDSQVGIWECRLSYGLIRRADIGVYSPRRRQLTFDYWGI